jgi:hypothetical protein
MCDVIILGVLLLALLLGVLLGFGKTLTFATGGIVGKVIATYFCYVLYSVVLNLPFVQNFIAIFVEYLASQENLFFNILLLLRVELWLFGVLLFVVVQLIRMLIVRIIRGVFEIDTPVMKFINRLGGAIFMLAIVVSLLLVVGQILAWTTGVYGPVYQYLEGSFIKLDYIFVHNPLNGIIESISLA